MTKTYKILNNGIVVNRIVATEEFISEYCITNGYTYEEYEQSRRVKTTAKPTESVETTTYDALAEVYEEGVNSID